MPTRTSLIFATASKYLWGHAAHAGDAQPRRGARDEAEDDADATVRSTGILPLQELEYQVKVTREIFAVEPIHGSQFQPASLDVGLGPVAYRVRASFLPGED